MIEPTVYGVHLFHANRLIAHRTTTDASPAQAYEVEGVWYDVVGYRQPHLEADGGIGWDVQVEPRG